MEYSRYADDLLIAVHQASKDQPRAPQRLREVAQKSGLDKYSKWMSDVVHEYKEKGYCDVEIGNGPLVRLTGEGTRYVESLIENRRPKTFWNRLQAVPRSDWIALGAFFVSLIALFR